MNNTADHSPPEVDGKSLFAPRDLVIAAIAWGFWVAGVMAAMNYWRLGFRRRGVRTALYSVFGYASLYLAVIRLLHTIGAGLQPTVYPIALGLVACIANGAVGYLLYRAQSGLYKDWRKSHPSDLQTSPYVTWWVSMLALSGAVAMILVIYYWLTL